MSDLSREKAEGTLHFEPADIHFVYVGSTDGKEALAIGQNGRIRVQGEFLPMSEEWQERVRQAMVSAFPYLGEWAK